MGRWARGPLLEGPEGDTNKWAWPVERWAWLRDPSWLRSTESGRGLALEVGMAVVGTEEVGVVLQTMPWGGRGMGVAWR